MEKALRKGFLSTSNKKKEGVGGNSRKKGDTKREGQVVSDKQASSSASNKGKDLCQRSWEEFDRSNKRPEAAPSSYEIEVHPSTKSIPGEVLKYFENMNKSILDQNSEYKELQAVHLAKSRQEILQTAEIACGRAPEGQPKKALLLGVGNALDIPLQELAERFDHLTVVELDRTSAEQAIKKLSPDLQPKIKLVVADISGVAGEICNQIENIVDNSDSQTKFFKRATKAINDIKGKVTKSVPNFESGHAFVCSQLVLSQLLCDSELYIHDIAKNKYGELYNESHDFRQEIENLRLLVHKAHINFLASSVIPQGTVHFADTFINYGRVANTFIDRKLELMYNAKDVNKVIEAKFKQMKELTCWVFDQHKKLRLGVMSYRLEPKVSSQKSGAASLVKPGLEVP